MNSPICVSNISVTNRKQTASFRIAGLMLGIAPLWMMPAVIVSVRGQTLQTDRLPDWTQFHRNNMQRWNPYETVLGVINAGTLALKWSYVTGNPNPGNNEGRWSSPAVVNGVMYIGSDDDRVYALNAATGVKLWSYTTGGIILFLTGSSGWSSLCSFLRRLFVCSQRQHRGQAVELLLGTDRRCSVLAYSGERGSLFQLVRRQRGARSERQHRRLAVELHHRKLCLFLARCGEWGGLCRLL